MSPFVIEVTDFAFILFVQSTRGPKSQEQYPLLRRGQNIFLKIPRDLHFTNKDRHHNCVAISS